MAAPEVEGEYGLTAYPNPTDGHLDLNIMMDLDDVANIDVYGIDGRLVMNIANDVELFMDEVQYIHADLSGLETGIYFVSVRTQSGELMTEKVQLVK
ncbi:MAG: T9SS type A sorting domain-containing protein [Flavobacteriales bacterium]|nr:T9SS type A sorting domain-containing protein [Flavobacteriales bacterium]